MPQEGPEFDKALKQVLMADMRQPELADARGVDQIAPLGEVEEFGGGRGVSALAAGFRQGAYPQIDTGQQGVDQGRFAHP